MSKHILRALVCITFIAAIFVCAVNTNWFRYRPGLVELVVILMYLAGFLLVISFSLVVLLSRKNHPALLIIAVLLNLGFPVWAVWGNWQTFAFSAKEGFDYVDRLPAGMCSSNEGDIKYWVELKNPWSKGHKEYLLIEKKSGEQIRIPIKIFDEQPTAYLRGTSNDWGRLLTTEQDGVYSLILNKGFILDGVKKIRIDTLGMTSSVIEISGSHQKQ